MPETPTKVELIVFRSPLVSKWQVDLVRNEISELQNLMEMLKNWKHITVFDCWKIASVCQSRCTSSEPEPVSPSSSFSGKVVVGGLLVFSALLLALPGFEVIFSVQVIIAWQFSRKLAEIEWKVPQQRPAPIMDAAKSIQSQLAKKSTGQAQFTSPPQPTKRLNTVDQTSPRTPPRPPLEASRLVEAARAPQSGNQCWWDQSEADFKTYRVPHGCVKGTFWRKATIDWTWRGLLTQSCLTTKGRAMSSLVR